MILIPNNVILAFDYKCQIIVGFQQLIFSRYEPETKAKSQSLFLLNVIHNKAFFVRAVTILE